MRMKWTVTATTALLAFATAASAQQPNAAGDVSVSGRPGGGGVAAERAIEISATVMGIDKAARKVTLKGPRGNTVDIVAGDEVRNFDQIKVGDRVVANYVESLVLDLRETKGPSGDIQVSEGASRADRGQPPAADVARQINAIVDVIAVDPKNKTITVKGPLGNVVVLDVQNPDQFKVVKKGDQVNVTYTQALALSLEPRSAPAKSK